MDLGACTLGPGDQTSFLQDGVFPCSGLESIVLPRTLRVIGERKFAGCKNLKYISFGEDSELEEIGQQAFYGCGFESFVAPPKLKKIGAVAFGNCRSLRNF